MLAEKGQFLLKVSRIRKGLKFAEKYIVKLNIWMKIRANYQNVRNNRKSIL